MLPDIGLMQCPDMAVSMNVMHHVVHVESSYNPYAIGVVGGRLVRQPKNLPEALATVRMLESRGYNFSLGLAQVNRYNLVRYGIDSYEKAFEVCPNLQAGSKILAECYRRSNSDWGKSFSCYYSGDFATGFRHGYVQKIYASIRGGWNGQTIAVDPMAIPLVERRVAAAATTAPVPAQAAPAPARDAGRSETRAVADSRIVSTSRLNASPAAVQPSSTITPLVQAAPSPASQLLALQQAQAQINPSPAAAQAIPSAMEGPVMLTPDGPVMPGSVTASAPPVAAAGAASVVDAAFVF